MQFLPTKNTTVSTQNPEQPEATAQAPSGFWQTARTNSKLRRHTPPIQAVSRDRPLPLSFHQERLWSLEQLHPGSSVHNVLHKFQLSGALNLSALKQSVQDIVRRHESLRTTFVRLDGQVVQAIAPDVDVPLPFIDLQHLPAEQHELAVHNLALADAEQPFDLTQLPLWRFRLVRLSETEHVLIRTIHHIIFDGMSHSVFLRELGMLYKAFAAGDPSPLCELPIQYADFAHAQREWLKGNNLSRRLDFWQQHLSGDLPTLELPTDYPRSALTTYRGASQSFELSNTLTAELKTLSYQSGVSLFVTVFTAFNVLLHCYTKQVDLLMCSPVAGRHWAETKGLIGYFNNLVMMRSDLSGDPTFRDLLQRISQVSLDAYEHQDTPLQKVAELPSVARVPLTRAMFVLQNVPNPSLQIEGLTIESRFVNRAIADFDISLSMEEQAGQLTGAMQYKTDLFKAERIAHLIEQFQTLLTQLVANPDLRLSELPSFAAPGVTDAHHPRNATVRHAEYVAPRTIVEQQLTQIWEEILDIQPIGIQDNFFELGGYSLLALRLFTRIEEVFGKGLPLSTLLSAPTLEQLAAVIDGTQNSAQNGTQNGIQNGASQAIVLLRQGSAEPPLFLIHDGNGEILLYRNLANYLKPERTVYGVQPYRKDGYPILHTRIPDMAAYYVKHIRSVQPEGPYLLSGLCAGGILAFEVARQLQQQGQTVAMVGIIDAADVKATKRMGRIAGERLSSFSKTFGEGQHMQPHQRVFHILKKIGKKVTNLITYEVGSKFQTVRNQVRLRLFRYYLDQGLLDRGLPLPRILQNIPVRDVFTFAEQDYLPGLYDGELVLFRATQAILDVQETGIDDEPYIHIYSDPLLGWGMRSTRSVRIYDISGGHSSMLQEPNVVVMAERMQECIELALQENTNLYDLVA